MKTITLSILLVLVTAASAFGQKAATAKVGPDPSKAVRDAFERLVDGIKQVDVDKVMNSYEKSDRLLIFNNNGSATIGWDNVKSNVTSSYEKVKNVTLDVTGLRVEMLGKTVAYVTCKWKQSQENNGVLENASGRMSLVYRLIGKEWKVVHRHTSPERPAANQPVFPSERISGDR
ncbi:MAG: nuclear transport factor 2 family protein [Pyrinomonadaceae bacterium]